MNGAQNDYQQGTYQEAQVNQGPETSPQGQPGAYGAGYGAQAQPDFNRKSPVLATLFSLMPGLGQVYVGYYIQGFINVFIAAGTIAILASTLFRGAVPFMAMSLAFFWIFQMVDANRRAYHYNRVMEGLKGEEVPDGFGMPKTKGSILGGAVLIFIGILFILDLNFAISMEWIENWWPLALILAGANLIFKARKKAE